jgi:hypothetical protein
MQENYKQEFVHFFFELRNNLYFYHLSTTSYARHKAAGELVATFDKLIDNFLETLFGKYNRPTKNLVKFSIEVTNNTDIEMVNKLNEYTEFLTNTLPRMLNDRDTDLLNIRDEMLGEINNTKYLFTLH